MSATLNYTMGAFDSSGVEFIHSSEIIEFFWFFTSFLLFFFTVLRIFKYKENFSVEENQSKPALKPKQPDIQQQNLYEKGSQNQEDKIVLEDIHAGMDQHNVESPEIGLDKSIKANDSSKGSMRDFMENLIFKFMPFLGIVILNIVNFGSYIFLAFMSTFWFLVVLLFNYLEIFRKYGLESLQTPSEIIHLVIVFSMYINYFVNDQSQI